MKEGRGYWGELLIQAARGLRIEIAGQEDAAVPGRRFKLRVACELKFSARGYDTGGVDDSSCAWLAN